MQIRLKCPENGCEPALDSRTLTLTRTPSGTALQWVCPQCDNTCTLPISTRTMRLLVGAGVAPPRDRRRTVLDEAGVARPPDEIGDFRRGEQDLGVMWTHAQARTWAHATDDQWALRMVAAEHSLGGL